MVGTPTLDERKWLAAELLTTVLVKNAPKDKWNLALNGIRIVQDDGEYAIAIGGEVAPYAKYTNEDWDNFKEPLKGKKNPNEGWIQESIEEATPYIKRIFSETYSEADVKSLIAKYNEELRTQYSQVEKRKQTEIIEIESGKR